MKQKRRSIVPQSKSAQSTLVVIAALVIAASGFYAGWSAERVNAAAEIFVAKYQQVDQTPYRAKR